MSLLERIRAADEESGVLLEDNCILEDEDIQALCYESLKDIIPGGGRKIIQRSKVWKIIQSSLMTEQLSTGSSSSTCSSSRSLDEKQIFKPGKLTLPSVEEKPVNSLTPRISCQSPIDSILLSRPSYSIYSDADVIAGSKNGEILKETRNRLIRSTINNMTSAASHPAFNRLPTTAELEEMAKSMVITYPCLRDAETGHGVVFKQLKRRISNIQPVKRPQGPCPKKKKYNTLENKEDGVKEEPLKQVIPCAPQDSESSFNIEIVDERNPMTANKEMTQRHYKALQREMQKKKPDVKVVNVYLNKEFEGRRNWLQMIPAAERCKELLDGYPCFRDHVEVIEEARRVLQVDEGKRHQFMLDCVERLVEELEFLIFYGINAKGMNPPKSPKLNAKIIYVLRNLSTIFPPKKASKKATELVHELKDYEDPDSWSGKQSGNLPVLVYDKEFVYVIVGRRILFQADKTKFAEATVGFVAAFYLLDFDYPKHCEIGMNILQYFVFKDKNIPEDVAVAFSGMLKSYKHYKSEAI